nr:hypothetical protein [Sphaerisporangium perillae]
MTPVTTLIVAVVATWPLTTQTAMIVHTPITGVTQAMPWSGRGRAEPEREQRQGEADDQVVHGQGREAVEPDDPRRDREVESGQERETGDLLAVRGHADSRGPTIGELAAYLCTRHHSTVQLIDRVEQLGLVARNRGEGRIAGSCASRSPRRARGSSRC